MGIFIMTHKQMIESIDNVFESCFTEDQLNIARCWANEYNKKHNSTIIREQEDLFTIREYRLYNCYYEIVGDYIRKKFNELIR